MRVVRGEPRQCPRDNLQTAAYLCSCFVARHARRNRARQRAISAICRRPRPAARRDPEAQEGRARGRWSRAQHCRQLDRHAHPGRQHDTLQVRALDQRQSRETKYPDLDCVGKLTRAGSSKSYVFFIEVITKGQAEKGGRCPDGTMTVARQGDDLSLGWFGGIQGTTVVAYGVLKKK